MIFLAKLGVGVVGTVLVAGAAVSSEGFIHVKVHEKQADGTNLNLIVPAALATTALHFVPARDLGARDSAQLRQCLPIIDAAIPALRDAPDGVLVEVVDAQDHVLVQKIGGAVVVDVNDPEDVVHVSVPLGAAQNAIHEIAEKNSQPF
ncbi:MAG TPA: hypothetical protein VJO35_05500 [Terriglobales bacterium]|nr:hypothetical protein [Terriglobales bacterium]